MATTDTAASAKYRVTFHETDGIMLWPVADIDAFQWVETNSAREALDLVDEHIGRMMADYDCDNYAWSRRKVAEVKVWNLHNGRPVGEPESFTTRARRA